jgi:hypothetical protein
VLGDIRTVDLDSGHDLAMLLLGELNTITGDDAGQLPERVAASSRPGGTLLIEAHGLDSVVEEGTRHAGRSRSHEGLFSGRHHLVLSDQAWDEASAAATTRFHVLDDTEVLTEYAEALHADTADDRRDVPTDAGFERGSIAADVGAFEDAAPIVLTTNWPEPVRDHRPTGREMRRLLGTNGPVGAHRRGAS